MKTLKETFESATRQLNIFKQRPEIVFKNENGRIELSQDFGEDGRKILIYQYGEDQALYEAFISGLMLGALENTPLNKKL
jgi:hypothetical protein